MTEHDPRDPPEQEYVEHLKAILEQEALIRAADAQKSEPVTPFLTRVPVVAIVALIFGTVVTQNVRAWTPEPVHQPVAAQARANQLSVLVASQEVERFREEHGRLPASLEEVGLPVDAYEYVVAGEQYQLRPAGSRAGESPGSTYDSRTGPADVLRALAEPIPTDG